MRKSKNNNHNIPKLSWDEMVSGMKESENSQKFLTMELEKETLPVLWSFSGIKNSSIFDLQ
jgi:hypothetical protein